MFRFLISILIFISICKPIYSDTNLNKKHIPIFLAKLKAGNLEGYISDSIENSLITFLNEIKKYSLYRLLERANLEAIIKEQKLSDSDLADPNNAIKIGRIISAKAIVYGSVIKTEDKIKISLRLINTENSEIMEAVEIEFKSIRNISKACRIIVYKLVNAFDRLNENDKKIIEPAEDPVFSPASGTFSPGQKIVIICETPDGVIRYTTDNSTPSKTKGEIYDGPIEINKTTIIKAVSYRKDMSESKVVSETYTIINDNNSETREIDNTPPMFKKNLNINITGLNGGIAFMGLEYRFWYLFSLGAKYGYSYYKDDFNNKIHSTPLLFIFTIYLPFNLLNGTIYASMAYGYLFNIKNANKKGISNYSLGYEWMFLKNSSLFIEIGYAFAGKESDTGDRKSQFIAGFGIKFYLF